jgi:sulfur carrier protein
LLIQVNGEQRDVGESVSLQELLSELSIPDDRVAIEVNQSIVRRAEWASAVLREGDKVEIVHFVGGGSNQEPAAQVRQLACAPDELKVQRTFEPGNDRRTNPAFKRK